MDLGKSQNEIEQGHDLTQATMRSIMDAVMTGQLQDSQVASLLLQLRAKGEAVEEIAGAAESLRRHMVPVEVDQSKLVDTCGTGGDASGTFNVSTAAAIVAAAAGVPIAKHGNRSVTSRTGSADVLEQLGVKIDLDAKQVAACINQVGIGFCFAPQMHPAMKHVAKIRRELKVPTIFNLLGPLCNPAGAGFQLIGVGKRELQPKLAAALALLGTERSWLVHGRDGLDEITTQTETTVFEVHEGHTGCSDWHPDRFGIPVSNWNEAVVDGPEESAAMIQNVLNGQPGVGRDLVVINASAAIALGRQSQAWEACREAAEEAIDSGDAKTLLNHWIEMSHS